MRKFILVALTFLMGSLVSYLVFNVQNSDFKNLSSAEMHQRIIEERDFAIGQAVAKGDYRCCINPPCTMCFMEANQWNNHTPGTCACDDMIAKGEEPCPQCKTGLIKDTGYSCEFNSQNCEE